VHSAERERVLGTLGHVLEQSNCALRGMMEGRDACILSSSKHRLISTFATRGAMVAAVSPYDHDLMLSDVEHARRWVPDLVRERQLDPREEQSNSSYNIELVKYKE
jgi:hypothetical protein